MPSSLVAILSDIVQAEYAQWLRYTYLSALQYGLSTDTLHEHFKEHADDEEEHAALISRWIVDLGGLPPTVVPPIEQLDATSEEAIDWLLQTEIDGINKYQVAHDAAEGIFGLQNDIGEILSTEHEHLSDIMKFREPVSQAVDEDVVIILASKYKDYKFYKHTASNKKLANTFSQYLRDLLEMAWYRHEYDYTPQIGLGYATEHVKRALMSLHQRIIDNDQSARSEAAFPIEFYRWLTNPTTERNWLQIHYAVWPEYHSDPAWQDPEAEKEQEMEREKAKPTFEQSFQELQNISKQISPPNTTPEVTTKSTPTRSEFSKGVESTIEIYDAGKSNAPEQDVMFLAGPGDRIKNMDLTGEDVPLPGRPGRREWNEGVIKEITPHGTIMVNTGKGMQEWDPAADRIEIDAKDRTKYIGLGKMVKQSQLD